MKITGITLRRIKLPLDMVYVSSMYVMPDVTRTVIEELREIAGVTATPRFTRIFRWPKSMAQYTVGHPTRLAEIESRVRAHIAEHGEITVAALRDQLGSSRKFTLTVLEYFDTRHLTRRVGDKRSDVSRFPRAKCDCRQNQHCRENTRQLRRKLARGIHVANLHRYIS